MTVLIYSAPVLLFVCWLYLSRTRVSVGGNWLRGWGLLSLWVCYSSAGVLVVSRGCTRPGYACRFLLLAHVLLFAILSGPLLAQQPRIMVFPQVQQIAAPNGLEFKAAPSLNARTTQTIAEATVFRGKGYLDTPEGRFFLSEKSLEKLKRGEAAYWAYIFGVSGGAKGVPTGGRGNPDQPSPNQATQGGDGDTRWAYEFLPKPESEAKVSRFSASRGRRLLLANDEWIVTSSFIRLGLGRGRCELVFHHAATLLEEERVSVPNDVIHMGWNKGRGQFLAITTCGGDKTRWIKYPDHCAQALVLIDLRARKIEAAPVWKDTGNDGFKWAYTCTPLWSQNGVSIPYAPDNENTVPVGQIRFQAREFADVKGTFFKQPAAVSRSRLSGAQPERAGLGYLGIVASNSIDPYENGSAPLLQASANTVTVGDRRGIHLIRPTAAGGILDLNFSTLKSNSHKVADSLVRKAGIFNDGVVRCMTQRELIFVTPERRSVVPITESGKPDPDLEVDFNDQEGYLARWVRKNGSKPKISKVSSSGIVESEKVAIPGNLNWRDYFGFKLNADHRTIAVMHDGPHNQMYWIEFSWKDGSLASPPFEANTGKSMSPGDRIKGLAPDTMELTSDLTEYTTAGRGSTVFLVDKRTNRKYMLDKGTQRGESPLVATMDGPNAAHVLSSGSVGAQLERVDLQSGKVSEVAAWSWNAYDGQAFFEESANWLFIPCKDGYQMFQLFGKQPSRKLAEIYFDGDGGYAIILPDGIYAGSPGCERLLRLRAASGMVEAGVLAQWRNRPGEVLKALNGDTAQVGLMEQVTRRWMNRSGFDPNAAEPPAKALPELRCPRLPNLWAASDKLSLPLEVRAGNAPIREVIVRVNGALAISIPAQDFSFTGSGSATASAEIKLACGQNWIEVKAVDANGRSGNTERFRTILKDAPVAPKRYVIAMGVSKYARPELDLDYAAKDAKELLEVLRGSGKSRTCETLLLTDAEVEPQALQKIAGFLAKSTESDEVILFCAGHGTLDENQDYLFAGHDFDPQRPGQTGIRLDDLVGVITATPARKRLMLLDTCQAGLVGEAEEGILAQNAGNLAPGVRSIRLRGSASPDAARRPIPDAQRFVEELYLLPGLIRGMNIIGASGGAQFAFEMEQLKNGVFTAAAIEALRSRKADANKDGRVTVSELRDYLSRRVPELTGNAQRPSVVAFERDQDFELITK